MTANELAHLLFYGMTQGHTELSDIHYFCRYLSSEEKTKVMEEFCDTFSIPMEYLEA